MTEILESTLSKVYTLARERSEKVESEHSGLHFGHRGDESDKKGSKNSGFRAGLQHGTTVLTRTGVIKPGHLHVQPFFGGVETAGVLGQNLAESVIAHDVDDTAVKYLASTFAMTMQSPALAAGGEDAPPIMRDQGQVLPIQAG